MITESDLLAYVSLLHKHGLKQSKLLERDPEWLAANPSLSHHRVVAVVFPDKSIYTHFIDTRRTIRPHYLLMELKQDATVRAKLRAINDVGVSDMGFFRSRHG